MDRKKQEENKRTKERKGIFDASPKNTFVMGFLTGTVICLIIGLILSLTVLRSGGNNTKVAGAEVNSNTNTAPKRESNVSPSKIAKYANELKLDIGKFNDCLNNGDKKEVVTAKQQSGLDLNVNGTPDTFINGYEVPGALPLSEFENIISEILKGEKPTSQYVSKKDPVDIKINKDDHVKGNGDKLTFIIYSDFECPYSERHSTTMEQLYKKYKDQAKFVFREFPLTSIHPNAEMAAEAAECAADQGKFWEMHDKMFGLR